MTVEIGQVWEDLDPRMIRETGRRRFVIIGFRGEQAHVWDVDTRLETHISLRRLRSGSRGYRLAPERSPECGKKEEER